MRVTEISMTQNVKAIAVVMKNNKFTSHVFVLVSTGPGQLTAEVRGPAGTVPCEIDHRGNGRYLVSFMPRMPGMYFINMFGVIITNSPIGHLLVTNFPGVKWL